MCNAFQILGNTRCKILVLLLCCNLLLVPSRELPDTKLIKLLILKAVVGDFKLLIKNVMSKYVSGKILGVVNLCL